MRKFTFFRCALLCVSMIAITQLKAQTGFPTCSKLPKCVSNDLEVAGAFLTATQCTCPEGGSTIKATLNMKINNKTGSTRTSFAFFANLVQTDPATGNKTTRYITGCGGPVDPNKITTLSFPDEYEFTCGRTLTLTNIYLAWTDASDGKKCPLSFCTIAPKCGFPQVDINIVPLLSATATTSPACQGQSDGSITVNAIGGTSPYTYSTDNITYQTSNVFNNLAAGSYTFYVKDKASTPCLFSFTKTLGDKSCCTTPVINDQPDPQTKCSGANTSFTVGSTGGVPSPTIQWQVSTDGNTFNNISNGAPYSGVTEATLTVTGVTSTMNGYKYRAVLTSGTCAPATSNAALLTVNAIPQAPSAEYNAPACNEDKFSVSITGVVSNAIYTIKNKDGNNITGVSPASPYTAPNANNFSFSNIPAGSGYQISVSVSGCPSTSSSNCGVTQALVSKSVVEPVSSADAITNVKVAPNPYNDRIRFTLQASESGKGVLELYSIMGQKLKTVFEGHVDKGQTKTIEYNVPFSQRAMMVYVFRIGSQKAAGKLISSR